VSVAKKRKKTLKKRKNTKRKTEHIKKSSNDVIEKEEIEPIDVVKLESTGDAGIEEPEIPKKIPDFRISLWILLAISLILLLTTFDPKVFRGGDNAYYLSLGRSILHGNYANEVSPNPTPETGVPPLYPFVLAILNLIFGWSFLPAKILSLIFYMLTLWIWFKFFKRIGFTNVLIYGIILMASLNPRLAEYSHWEITEALFMFISSATFLYYFIAKDKNRPKDWFILGLLSVLCYFTRASGASVSIAIFITMLINRKWKPLLWFSIGNALLLAPWLLRNMLLSGEAVGGFYVDFFLKDPVTQERLTAKELLAKFLKNSHKYIFVNFPRMILALSGFGMGIQKYFFVSFGGSVAIFGAIRTLKKYLHIALYIVIYLVIHSLFFEAAAQVRYLVVLFPFVVGFFLMGILEFIKLVKPSDKPFRYRVSYIFLSFMLLMTLSGYCIGQFKTFPELRAYAKGNRFAGIKPSYVGFIQANEWIRDHCEPEAVVLSRKPRLTWYFSHHKSLSYPYAGPDEIWEFINDNNIRYMVVDRFAKSTIYYLVPTISKHVNYLDVLYKSKVEPPTYVVRVRAQPKKIVITDTLKINSKSKK